MPPFADTVTEVVDPVQTEELIGDEKALRNVGWPMVSVVDAVHPLASVAMTMYDAADNPDRGDVEAIPFTVKE